MTEVYSLTRRSRPQRSAAYCGVLPQKAQPLCLMPFGRCPKRSQTLHVYAPLRSALCSRFGLRAATVGAKRTSPGRSAPSASKCSLCMPLPTSAMLAVCLLSQTRKLFRIHYETERSAILLARQSPATLPSGVRGWGSRSPLADFVLSTSWRSDRESRR